MVLHDFFIECISVGFNKCYNVKEVEYEEDNYIMYVDDFGFRRL